MRRSAGDGVTVPTGRRASKLLAGGILTVGVLLSSAVPAAAQSKVYGTFSHNCRARITEDSAWQMTNHMNREGTSGCVQNWTFYRRSDGVYTGYQNHGSQNLVVRATAEPMVQAVGRAYINSSEYYWGRTAW